MVIFHELWSFWAWNDAVAILGLNLLEVVRSTCHHAVQSNLGVNVLAWCIC